MLKHTPATPYFLPSRSPFLCHWQRSNSKPLTVPVPSGSSTRTQAQTKNPPDWVGFVCGGERGIRTLGTVLAFTRFPIVRLRPAQPSLHLLDFYIISQNNKKSIPFLKFFLHLSQFFQKIIKKVKNIFKKGIDISLSLCYNINVP